MLSLAPDRVMIIGNLSEDPFAIDVGHQFGQVHDLSDIIALSAYANSEFCPRFISDEADLDLIGRRLEGLTVVIVSTTSDRHTRQSLAMRNLILARAAKDNGAERVILLEPDLFYSAQDRGPRPEHVMPPRARSVEDRKKFDGQAFTSLLYAQLLKTAGVDAVVTVHNHSHSVQTSFSQIFDGAFYNLLPAELYADYLRRSSMVDAGGDGENLVVCAPDRGAVEFTELMLEKLGLPKVGLCLMSKQRSGERQVSIQVDPASPIPLAALEGKDVIVFDDMVRTGSTIVKCCEILRTARPRRVVFAVTHFYASNEGRENMASDAIDEILTLNTLPTILNRDSQGRLRKKMVVLKIERWIARFLLAGSKGLPPLLAAGEAYSVDISSKNPRWRTPLR